MNKNELGSVILRIIVGLTFFIHGITKFQSGISHTVTYFGNLGIPEFLAYAVALFELVGGIGLILGIGIRINAVLFACIMLGAIITSKLSAGFLGTSHSAGYEFELSMFVMCIYLILANPTIYSVIHFIQPKQ